MVFKDNATTRERAKATKWPPFLCARLWPSLRAAKEKEKQSKKLGAFNEIIEPIGQVVNLRQCESQCKMLQA